MSPWVRSSPSSAPTERARKTLDAAPTGRVGLWSKADSQVLFDEFRVEKL
jgi:hypothetical protein